MTTYIALDLETEQVARMPRGKIHALFLAGDDGAEFYQWGMAAQSVLDQLLAEPDVIFVIQNAAFDVWVLRHHGVDIPPGRYVDTMVLAHCVNPQQGDYSLESYGRSIDDEKLDYPKALIRSGLWDGDSKDPALYDVPFNPIMRDYGLQDVRLTLKWWRELLPHLERDARLADSYYNIHLPAVETTISLHGGLYIDRKATLKAATELMGDIEEGYLEFARRYPRVYKMKWNDKTREYDIVMKGGKPVMTAPNLQSPNDMASLLYMMGWVPTEFKRSTGKPVTSQDVLKLLIADDETPPKLKECATFVQSLRSLVGIQNQLMQLLELVDADGFVKGNWYQTGTQTFRYSSSSPNMQNFSTRHPKWGKRVRGCFTPPPGYVMFMGDLSQIELAIVAWYLEILAGDSAMAEGNRQGKDAHDTNTENWYGVTKEANPAEFKQFRPRAKNGAFAANYGAKYRRLAFTIGCSFQEAKEILETVERATQITPLKQLVWDTMRQPRDVLPVQVPYSWRKTTKGFLYDCLNTRLFYPGIDSKERYERESSERKSFNALAQGGCASILRKLCNQSLPYIQAGEGWFAGLVHDEAIGYVKEQYAEETLAHLNREWNSLKLPSPQGGVFVRAEFKLVDSWSDK